MSSQQAPAIVPRWEWRTFATDFGAVDAELEGLTPERTEESAEVYLLSALSDASVKLRDGLVDVKRLERVGDDGLELWMPVMKAPFPLSAEEAATVLSALSASVPTVGRTEYAREDFVNELVAPNPNLLAVSVRKRRTHYRIDACMVESTDIDTDAGTIRTIAIESPDRALVSATVVRLGLDGRENVNMARGLKRLVGFGGRPNAVIDVGTNSVKFYLAEQRADGTTRTIADRAEVTRLGEGLDESGALSAEAIRRTVDAVCALHDEALSEGADTIAVVGTAGLRSASNRDAFDEALRARCGLTIETISGDEEGRLAYLAATAAMPLGRGRRVVFDGGGGSTQFTFGHGDQVDDRFSLDVGAVRVTDRYGLVDAVSEERLSDVLDAMAADLGRLDGASTPEAIIAMGGTVTNLAAVKHGLAQYDADVVEGTALDLEEIDRQIECYRTRSATERRDIVGLQSNRANVILGGACLVRAIVTKLGSTSFTVSTRGLRHGVFLERFAPTH